MPCSTSIGAATRIVEIGSPKARRPPPPPHRWLGLRALGFGLVLTLCGAVDALGETVRIATASGVMLQAELTLPSGPASGPAVVALHGCGGPKARDADWATRLAALGHIVLRPDNFGSRGLGSQCREQNRSVRTTVERRLDAIEAARWLTARAGTPDGGIVLMGWSNGGNTVLWTAADRSDLPPGLFRSFIAFYPGCATVADGRRYTPAAPLLILVGASDDWTPAAPCVALGQRLPDAVTVKVFPGAYHDFDAPDQPVRVLTGLTTPPDGSGRAHAGTDPAARAEAINLVPRFIDDPSSVR